jgi:hypothetical protein
MLKVNLITLSDYASVSREGKLSIDGIFDKLNVVTFPTTLVRAFFVATVTGETFTEYKLDLSFKKGTKEIASFNLNSTTGENGKNNLIVELAGLPIESEGEYKLSLAHNKKELGSAILEVVSVTENQAEVKLPN